MQKTINLIAPNNEFWLMSWNQYIKLYVWSSAAANIPSEENLLQGIPKSEQEI